jgi:hypothetical protein
VAVLQRRFSVAKFAGSDGHKLLAKQNGTPYSTAMAGSHSKKEIEKWFLKAALDGNVILSDVEIVDFEQPDFRLRTTSGEIGIEVTELLRIGTGTRPPVHQDSIHAKVMTRAEEGYSIAGALPVRVIVYFRGESEKYSVRELARELSEYVALHATKANPVFTSSNFRDLHPAFSSITIDSLPGAWFHGEAGSITVNEIYNQLASRITAKNQFLPMYRTRLPNVPIWLLIYSSIAVSRGMPIPHGIDEHAVDSGFEKILFYSQQDRVTVEIPVKPLS